MSIKLLAGGIEEYLSGNGLNPVLICHTGYSPDINEFDIKPAFVLRFQFFEDGYHLLAGNARRRPQVQQPWASDSAQFSWCRGL